MKDPTTKADLPVDDDMKDLYEADGALDDLADALVETVVVSFETEDFGEVEAVVRTEELELES